MKDWIPNLSGSGVNAFRALFVGPSFSGKSYLIREMLTSGLLRKFRPENVFLISKTGLHDSAYKGIGIPSYNIYTRWNKDLIERVRAEQEELKIGIERKTVKKRKLPRVLFIIDDMIGSLPAQRNDNELVELFALGRHLNISVIISMQDYSKIPRSIRRNTSHTFIFRLDQGDLRMVKDEQPLDYDDFKRLYKKAISIKGRGWLLLNKMDKSVYVNGEKVGQ